MSKLEDVQRRFQEARAREAQLAAEVHDIKAQARAREAIELQIEAHEAAEALEAKITRYRELLRELPVLQFDFDQAGRKLLPLWWQMENRATKRRQRLQKLLVDHRLDRDFDTKGRHKSLGYVQGYTLPGWVPAESRPVFTQNGDYLMNEQLVHDYTTERMGDVLARLWNQPAPEKGADNNAQAS